MYLLAWRGLGCGAPSVRPGQFIARSALGRKRPLFTGNAGQGCGPRRACSGACPLSEAQGRRVLFSGMSPFYCCLVFPRGSKRRVGSAVVLAAHPWCVGLSLKHALAVHVCAGASKQEQPIHPSTCGTRLVNPHRQAFSGPSTYAGPGWARGHSPSWSPSPCVLCTARANTLVL